MINQTLQPSSDTPPFRCMCNAFPYRTIKPNGSPWRTLSKPVIIPCKPVPFSSGDTGFRQYENRSRQNFLRDSEYCRCCAGRFPDTGNVIRSLARSFRFTVHPQLHKRIFFPAISIHSFRKNIVLMEKNVSVSRYIIWKFDSMHDRKIPVPP